MIVKKVIYKKTKMEVIKEGVKSIGKFAITNIGAYTVIDFLKKKFLNMGSVPTFQINSLDDQKRGFAVTLLLAGILENTRCLYNVREKEFNFYGETHWYQIPQKDFRYTMKNDLGMTVFEILVFDGENPYNYVFHFFGDQYYFNMILNETEKYKNKFYIRNEEGEILIPKFFYLQHWFFKPEIIRQIQVPATVNIARQQEVLDFYRENETRIIRSEIKAILIHGRSNTGKSHVVNLIGLNSSKKRDVYEVNTEMQGIEFLESIEKVNSNSVIEVSDIDRVFKRTRQELHSDVLLKFFRFLRTNVFVIFTTNDLDELANVYGFLQNQSRIFQVFNFNLE